MRSIIAQLVDFAGTGLPVQNNPRWLFAILLMTGRKIQLFPE